jgi:L-threonylcarbamoyladenylate synthase
VPEPQVQAAIDALRDGKLAIVPTDTVYGLAASAPSEEAVRRLYRAKGRETPQPTALVAAAVADLPDYLPELDEQARTVAGALLPGPYTLVVANPARRYPWLTGERPETLGVRVPAVAGAALAVLAGAGAIAATSANLPGGRDPRRLEDVPPELRAAAAALVDGGALPGTPSTVLDLTGAEPRVLREGAVTAAEALQLVASVL